MKLRSPDLSVEESPPLPSAPCDNVQSPPVPELHQELSTRNHATDRCLQTLSRLEELLPSTTPGLKLPSPPLLLRVREEYKARTEAIREEIAAEGSGTATPLEDGSVIRARNFRIGGDVRVGLAALLTQVDSCVGWRKLQRLEVLESKGRTQDSDNPLISQGPSPSMFTFWGRGDYSIREVVENFSRSGEYKSNCQRAQGDANADQQIQWWYHNGHKVSMTTRRVSTEGDGIDVWVKCTDSGKTSQPRILGDAAA